MKKIIATIVFASACATTGRSLPVDSPSSGIAPRFSTNIAPSSQSDTATAWFPMLASDRCCRARRAISATEHGPRSLRLAVKLCVAPNARLRV